MPTSVVGSISVSSSRRTVSSSMLSSLLSKSKFSMSRSSSFYLGFGGMGFESGAEFVLPGFLPRLGLDIVVTSIYFPHSGHSN